MGAVDADQKSAIHNEETTVASIYTDVKGQLAEAADRVTQLRGSL